MYHHLTVDPHGSVTVHMTEEDAGTVVYYIEGDDGEFLYYWAQIGLLAGRYRRNLRFWQAVYLLLYEMKQQGIDREHGWPEVFYHEGPSTNPPPEFWERFEVIDGYLVPRDAESSVPAKVG